MVILIVLLMGQNTFIDETRDRYMSSTPILTLLSENAVNLAWLEFLRGALTAHLKLRSDIEGRS